MQLIHNLIYAVLVGWFITSFTPIHGIINLSIQSTKKYPLINFILSLLHTIVSCMKCSTFWSGLIITEGDIYLSLIASLIASIYSKNITI